jgi:hypothetical protein
MLTPCMSLVYFPPLVTYDLCPKACSIATTPALLHDKNNATTALLKLQLILACIIQQDRCTLNELPEVTSILCEQLTSGDSSSLSHIPLSNLSATSMPADCNSLESPLSQPLDTLSRPLILLYTSCHTYIKHAIRRISLIPAWRSSLGIVLFAWYLGKASGHHKITNYP